MSRTKYFGVLLSKFLAVYGLSLWGRYFALVQFLKLHIQNNLFLTYLYIGLESNIVFGMWLWIGLGEMIALSIWYSQNQLVISKLYVFGLTCIKLKLGEKFDSISHTGGVCTKNYLMSSSTLYFAWASLERLTQFLFLFKLRSNLMKEQSFLGGIPIL